MEKQATDRFEVIVEEGAPRGDLYQLEQTTTYRVVDTWSNLTVINLESKMEASLSSDSGLWADYRFSGVREIRIARDELSAIVQYHDGHEGSIPLPQ